LHNPKLNPYLQFLKCESGVAARVKKMNIRRRSCGYPIYIEAHMAMAELHVGCMKIYKQSSY
jgi:hypothetical protein